MARANRHHIPGQVWHIVHRCHKQEFLLKFSRDRKRWLQWLFQAKKRYGLQILNYAVTSNHIHLLVVDGDAEVVPKSLQLVAGKTAQEFNRSKNRKGAYWDDPVPRPGFILRFRHCKLPLAVIMLGTSKDILRRYKNRKENLWEFFVNVFSVPNFYN